MLLASATQLAQIASPIVVNRPLKKVPAILGGWPVLGYIDPKTKIFARASIIIRLCGSMI